MIVGSLGNVIFEVSDSVIRTFQKFERSGAARISEHARHGGAGLTEWTGAAAQKATLTFRVSETLGAKPIFEINRVKNYVQNGTIVKLIIGKLEIGFRWLVQDYRVTIENYDNEGMITDASISVTLIEYGRD